MSPKLRCRRLLQNISSTSLLERDLVKTGVIYLATRARRASTQHAITKLEASHTYILQSETNSRPFYTGCTTHRNRLAPHNSSDVPHTSKSNGTQAKAFGKSA
ncbi:MAG TPA: hypothetical protein VKC60_15820 [Opitutaceae bacterium]|nr:hypothetical protein [Opitutaceae bacterium]